MQRLIVPALILAFAAAAMAEAPERPAIPPQLPKSKPVPKDPGMPDDEGKIIMNYWVHINDLLKDDSLRRNTMTVRPGGKYVARKSYPFEGFGHLRAKDLLRAAREGIEAARTATWGKSQAEVERQITKNLITAFEYYPLLAQDDSDIAPLLHAIEDSRSEEMLRLFLLERCAPGLVSPSLFSTYLQETLARDPAPIRLALKNVIASAVESPRVLRIAIEALYAFYYYEYGKFLGKDPAVAAYAEKEGIPVTPAILLRADAPQLSGDVARLNSDYLEQWTEIARSLAEYFRPGTTRTPEVQGQARRCLERIYLEIPFDNRDAIKGFLDRATVAPNPA